MPCPLCQCEGNPLAIAEPTIEQRFGIPVLPTRDYHQAKCQNCGLLYINAPVAQEFLDQLYAQESVDWASTYLDAENGAMTDDAHRRFAEVVNTTAKFQKLTHVRWLDFGCQTGELGFHAMQQHDVEMTGVEISADYAARAAALWKREPDAVKPSLGQCKGMKFDVISSLETLEHLADPWAAIQTMRSLLEDDGIVVISMPSSQYFLLKYKVFKAIRSILDRDKGNACAAGAGPSIYGLCHTHLYNFTGKSVSLMLEQGGFHVHHVGGIGWLSPYWLIAKLARLIEIVSGGRIIIFPSVLAIASKA